MQVKVYGESPMVSSDLESYNKYGQCEYLSHYGDLYVEAEVETPINLSNKQRKILADFNDSISEVTGDTR